MDNLKVRAIAPSATRKVAPLLAVLVLGACAADSAQVRQSASAEPSASVAKATASPCQGSESVVFACTLEPSGDRIGICMDMASAGHRSYFVREHDGERSVISNSGQGPKAFTHSHLMYTGGTGGSAYAFDDNGETRVVYSISGAYQYEEQGTLLMEEALTAPARRFEACSRPSVIEHENEATIDLVRQWLKHPVIAGHGLPPRPEPKTVNKP